EQSRFVSHDAHGDRERDTVRATRVAWTVPPGDHVAGTEHIVPHGYRSLRGAGATTTRALTSASLLVPAMNAYWRPSRFVADACVPSAASTTRLNAVPRFSPTVFFTAGASFESFRTLAGVSPTFASRSTQSVRVDGVRFSISSARISRANRAAPSPTSITCGRRSMTARATEIGWW